MDHQISVRIPIDVFEELQAEALKHRISISNVVRQKLVSEKIITPKEKSSELDLVTIEILFLLREFIFEKNGQILKKIDEKMERQFGKERKKIL